MIRRSHLALPFLVLAAACSSSVTNNGSTPTGDGGTPTPTEDGGVTTATLPFTPSNLKLDGIDVSSVGDFVVSQADCSIRGDAKEVGCGDTDKLAFGIVDQPGGGKLGVYVARNIRIEPNAGFKAANGSTFAIAIVALESFDVQGWVDVGADSDYPSAGGYVHPSKEESKGGGPGGGGAGSSTNGGGGGAYCGTGGKGAATGGGAATPGGTPYGTPENIPLVGGSAGGAGALPGSGSGGGAIQLVAGKSFTLGAEGYVSAGGGGGVFAGAPNTQHGSGGGSGGAILIEAPTVTISGSLLANGGAGGSKEVGQDGRTDGTQAQGNAQTGGSLGGAGSFGEDPNGVDATWVATDRGPGGGGGAGRIRVNSTTGNSALSAKRLSPSANGPCMTEGKLKL